MRHRSLKTKPSHDEKDPGASYLAWVRLATEVLILVAAFLRLLGHG